MWIRGEYTLNHLAQTLNNRESGVYVNVIRIFQRIKRITTIEPQRNGMRNGKSECQMCKRSHSQENDESNIFMYERHLFFKLIKFPLG